MVSDLAPGTKVNVKLIRDGHEKTVTLALAELPGQTGDNGNGQSGSGSAISKTDALDGVTVADLDQDARQQLQLPDNVQGVVVTDVDPDSNSADAGLQRNDVIVEINHQPVTNADRAVELCKQARGNQILLKIWRRGDGLAGTRYLSVDNTQK